MSEELHFHDIGEQVLKAMVGPVGGNFFRFLQICSGSGGDGSDTVFLSDPTAATNVT